MYCGILSIFTGLILSSSFYEIKRFFAGSGLIIFGILFCISSIVSSVTLYIS